MTKTEQDNKLSLEEIVIPKNKERAIEKMTGLAGKDLILSFEAKDGKTIIYPQEFMSSAEYRGKDYVKHDSPNFENLEISGFHIIYDSRSPTNIRVVGQRPGAHRSGVGYKEYPEDIFVRLYKLK